MTVRDHEKVVVLRSDIDRIKPSNDLERCARDLQRAGVKAKLMTGVTFHTLRINGVDSRFDEDGLYDGLADEIEDEG